MMQAKHSQQASGSWLKALPMSVSSFIRSAGQMYMQAGLAKALQPSHLSGLTKVGIYLQWNRGKVDWREIAPLSTRVIIRASIAPVWIPVNWIYSKRVPNAEAHL